MIAVAPRLEGVEDERRLPGSAARRPAARATAAARCCLERRRRGLPQIDGDLRQRQRLLLLIDRAADDDRIAEAGLVLNPIEMDAQAERVVLVDAAALDEQRQRSDDAAGQLGDVGAFRQGGRRVVSLDDQVRVAGPSAEAPAWHRIRIIFDRASCPVLTAGALAKAVSRTCRLNDRYVC